MPAKPEIATHGDTSFTDSESVSLIKLILSRHRRVAAKLYEHDSWPNTDGFVEVLKKDKSIAGRISVQVKTLPSKHNMKFACPIELLNFSKKVEPTLLLLADNANNKVYWLYLDEDSVGAINYEANKSTKTLPLSPNNVLSEADTGYIEEWVTLATKIRDKMKQLTVTASRYLQNRIDESKRLIEKHRYSEALSYLENLKSEVWDTSDDLAKFRILTNTASAQFHLGKTAEAAENFLSAYLHQPHDEKAQSNKAFAYLLQDKYDRAIAEALGMLQEFPLNSSALAISIQAMALSGKQFEEIEAQIDTTTKLAPEVAHALANAARKAGRADTELEWLEYSYEQDKGPHVTAELAMALLTSVINESPTAIRGMLKPADKQRVERALALFQTAWSVVSVAEDRAHYTEWLFNKMVAYRLLGDLNLAELAAEELLDLKPDHELYLKNSVIIAFEQGKFTKAETLLRQLKAINPELGDGAILEADILKAQGKFREAIVVLEEFISKDSTHDDVWTEAQLDLFDLYLQTEQLASAELLAEKKSDVDPLVQLLFSARLARTKQDLNASHSFLEKAEQVAGDTTSKKLIIDLADEAFKSAAYKTAASLYAKVIDPVVENAFTIRYLQSLYETEQYGKVIEVASVILENDAASKNIVQLAWASYMALKDLEAAKKVLKSYLAKNENDNETKLRLAIIAARQGSTKELDAYLDQNIEFSNLSLISSIQLANLYGLRKRTDEYLKVLYDMRRRFADEADAHSAYTSLLLGAKDSLLPKPKETAANTAIIYEGGHFLIEADYPPRTSESEVSVAEAEERGFLGKKVGDKITLTANELTGNREAKIVEIKNKYIFALHESMQNYERQFPARNDLVGFSVADEDFDPLLKQLDLAHDRAQLSEELYRNGKITLDMFAQLVGRNLMEIVYALRATPDLGIRMAAGTVEETTNSDSLLEGVSLPILVADITALISFHALGLRPADLGIEKFVITQTTKDLVMAQLAQEKTFGAKHRMTLYKHEGKYIRQEISTKEQRARLKNLESLQRWIDRNAVVEGINQEQLDAIKGKAQDFEQLKKVLSEPQLDSLMLAYGENRRLLTDDLVFRSIASTPFSVKGAWTQLLLGHLTNKGNIDPGTYNKATVDLVLANYHHVSITAETLMLAYELAKWSPEKPLSQAVKSLTRPEVTIESMMRVIVLFIRAAFTKNSPIDRSAIIHLLLNESTRHHDANQVIALLRAGVGVAFKLLPLQAKEIDDAINSWLQLRGK